MHHLVIHPIDRILSFSIFSIDRIRNSIFFHIDDKRWSRMAKDASKFSYLCRFTYKQNQVLQDSKLFINYFYL